jgi:hypothetical protein
MNTGDELKAAVSARRDLGPEFEDAVVQSFLDKMGQEVDRRVDERLAKAGAGGQADRQNVANGQRLALAIVSMALGTVLTLALALFSDDKAYLLIPIWIGIVMVNAVFNGPRNKG